jgi:hypothetical protein
MHKYSESNTLEGTGTFLTEEKFNRTGAIQAALVLAISKRKKKHKKESRPFKKEWKRPDSKKHINCQVPARQSTQNDQRYANGLAARLNKPQCQCPQNVRSCTLHEILIQKSMLDKSFHAKCVRKFMENFPPLEYKRPAVHHLIQLGFLECQYYDTENRNRLFLAPAGKAGRHTIPTYSATSLPAGMSLVAKRPQPCV